MWPLLAATCAAVCPPAVRAFNRKLSRALGRRVNTNMYLTGPGVETSMSPHNDIQCTMIVQLAGAKRWRLWVVEALLLAVDHSKIWGKEPGKDLDVSRLGEPYMDVVLRRGDVLYVPQQLWHSTLCLQECRGSHRLLADLECILSYAIFAVFTL